MTFTHIVSAFFTAHLASERGLATHTIASYSDAMKLLINFACDRFHAEPETLRLEQLDRDLILEFLDHLEHDRHNSVSTRNQRLAAIKSFFHFLARTVPELLHLSATVQAIQEKKTDHQPPPSLTLPEVNAILAVPDTRRMLGARDNAMLQLLHNTGARAQEVADLTLADVRFDASAMVRLTGKGGKTRSIPLRRETLDAIHHYRTLLPPELAESDPLFVNIKGKPMTRFGIGRRVGKLAREAARACPSLRGRTVTPHLFRHTTALHFIEAGNDLAVVKSWLGHADIKTTNAYLEVSLQRKRDALEKVPPPSTGEPAEQPQWKQPKLMAFLSDLSRGVMVRPVRRKPHSSPASAPIHAT
jgi:site-specific recombinase XerD